LERGSGPSLSFKKVLPDITSFIATWYYNQRFFWIRRGLIVLHKRKRALFRNFPTVHPIRTFNGWIVSDELLQIFSAFTTGGSQKMEFVARFEARCSSERLTTVIKYGAAACQRNSMLQIKLLELVSKIT
jgi:hypothetical protein